MTANGFMPEKLGTEQEDIAADHVSFKIELVVRKDA